jgi:hypothetical protein
LRKGEIEEGGEGKVARDNGGGEIKVCGGEGVGGGELRAKLFEMEID